MLLTKKQKNIIYSEPMLDKVQRQLVFFCIKVFICKRCDTLLTCTKYLEFEFSGFEFSEMHD